MAQTDGGITAKAGVEADLNALPSEILLKIVKYAIYEPLGYKTINDYYPKLINGIKFAAAVNLGAVSPRLCSAVLKVVDDDLQKLYKDALDAIPNCQRHRIPAPLFRADSWTAKYYNELQNITEHFEIVENARNGKHPGNGIDLIAIHAGNTLKQLYDVGATAGKNANIIDILREELARLTNSNDQLRALSEVRDLQFDQVHTRIQSLHQENAELMQMYRDLDNASRDMQQELSDVKKERDELNKRHEYLLKSVAKDVNEENSAMRSDGRAEDVD